MFSRTEFAAAASRISVFCTAGGAVAREDGTVASAGADEAAFGVLDAIAGGELVIDLRYRFEFVDSSTFVGDAHASALRSALTYESAPSEVSSPASVST